MKKNSVAADSIKRLLVRVFKEVLKPHIRKIYIVIAGMIVAALSTAAWAYLIQPAVDETMMGESSSAEELLKIPLIIILVSVIKAISQYTYMVTSQNLTEAVLRDLRERMFKVFIRSDIKDFDKKSSGAMTSNMTNDLSSVVELSNLIISGVFLNLLMIIALFGNMLYQSWQLTLVSFLIFPLAYYPNYFVVKRIKRLIPRRQKYGEKFFSLLGDSLSAIKVVKSYNAEEKEIGRMSRMVNKVFKLNKKINRVHAFPSPFMEMLTGFGAALVIWFSGYQIAEGNMSVGQFFSFFTSLMIAYKPVKALAGFNAKLQNFATGSKRAFKIMDQEPKIINKPGSISLEKVKGDVRLEDISFSYSESDEVLRNIKIILKPGGKYALVGRSGSGKSTIFNLLLRFYEPQSGVIKIDKKDILEVTLESLRANISYVGQETHLFDSSVVDNIRYGNFDATEEEVIKAAKAAQAHEFIMQLENGYSTKLGHGGRLLSGGQRQRISIARAILKNAPILLLDEATSALDVENEKLVQHALEKLTEGRTTLVIAHRLSTVMNSDKIFVMDKGDVVESGSHEELLEKHGGLYKKLYESQFE
jgi:subfamily B ATP-binding cassette protein MsbA